MKAKIKNTPFEVDVEPFFLNGWFAGFKQENGKLFKADDLTFDSNAKLPVAPQRDKRLRDCNISVRLFNLLRYRFDNPDITLGEIADMGRSKITQIRKLGRKSFSEILLLLEENGLELK